MIVDPLGSGIRPLRAPIWFAVARGSGPMSMDKSLKKAGGLARSRNVLTRPERLALLQEDEKWTPVNGVFNLPKTKYRRLAPGQSGPKRPGV
jgi:small basic protein (TIGR04137 family)